jgi:hypothetical protein
LVPNAVRELDFNELSFGPPTSDTHSIRWVRGSGVELVVGVNPRFVTPPFGLPFKELAEYFIIFFI